MGRKTILQFIKALDFFAKPITFRYDDEPQYQSLTGGIVSIIMIIIFLIVFTNNVLSTFRRQTILYKSSTYQEQDPSYFTVGTNNFMFAVGISDINLNLAQGPQWFDVYMEKRVYNGTSRTKTIVNLKKCQRSQWTSIKKEVGIVYDKMNFNNWLCPPNGTVIELQGKFSSNVFIFYKIGIKACSQATATASRPCIGTENITAYINANQSFTFNYYFLNTILNPGDDTYVQSYVDDTNYLPFTPANGISANFFLSSYNISTDQSILPFVQQNKTSGAISNVPTQIINYAVKQKDYLKFYLRKSSLSLKIQRAYLKLDDTLSYIGGLFSAIVFGLFIIGKYNQYSYQLQVAKNLFHYQRNRPLKANQFNFIVFLGYLIYLFFYKININLNWPYMKKYHRSLIQVRKQMDMRLVMKKILYSQRMAIAVFDQHKANILHLQQPLTLEEAGQIRSNHRLYQKLERKFFNYKQIREKQITQLPEDQVRRLLKEAFEPSGLGKSVLSSNNINSSLFIANNNNNPFSHQNSNIINSNSFPVNNNNIPFLNPNYNNLTSENNINMEILTQIEGGQRKKKGKQKQQNQNIVRTISSKAIQLWMGDQTVKQHEVKDKIKQMRNNVKLLYKQAMEGDKVSENILLRFDPKLLQIFIVDPEKRKRNVATLRSLKIDPSISRNQFSEDNDQYPSGKDLPGNL